MPKRSTGRRGRDEAPASQEPVQLVSDPEEIGSIARRLAEQPVIAFDTEFLRERTFFPQLGLIQVADREESWLVDPLAVSPDDLRPLLDVFASPDVLKVAHAIEQDQQCLHFGYGVVAEPILDTSIAAALTGLGDQIGLAALMQRLLNIHLPKGHSRTDWLRRPMSAAMAKYAIADVDRLVEAAEQLLTDLDKRGRRAWAMEISAHLSSPERWDPAPQQIAEKIAAGKRFKPRDYAVLMELVDWREMQVREFDIPRRWLADDSLLVQLARAQPKSRAELADFRGLAARAPKFDRDRLIDAIRRGLEVEDDDLTKPPERDDPNSPESAALPVLKCFLTMLAREMDVAARWFVEPATVLALLRGRFENLDELRDSGILPRATVDIAGAEILAILNGRRALMLRDGKVHRYNPTKN